ncbi:alpha/beta fold hydrolase [Nocardiopsis sp. NPDC057823]|uniref:alpha/beta fold hydrolase n=1 Tax=Nocardiopsis sp. NPDC057823 TaxID=3346256 RepID=UPI0036730990
MSDDAPAAGPVSTTGTTTAPDGTVLGHRTLGAGPPVLLFHGSMMSSHDLLALGTALAERFTVHLADRRGRGLSGPHGPGHDLARATADVAALAEHTGAHGVFGLSAGAVPVLEWARTAPADRRIAVYEPPLRTGAFSPSAWLERFERELAAGRGARAMVTLMRGTQDPPWARYVPRPLLAGLMGLALRAPVEGGIPLRDLLPTMAADARMVREAEGRPLSLYSGVRAGVLLLGGSRSAPYFKDALTALDGVLPRARRLELPGQGHLAAANDGAPDLVARALTGFFSGAPPR